MLFRASADAALDQVRWNAASAIASFLSSPLLTTSPVPSLAPRLLDALSNTLSSSICPNYKVRIQAIAGLLVPSKRVMFGDNGDTFARVRERVKSAREELREEEEHVSKKEVGHWRQLVGRVSLD